MLDSFGGKAIACNTKRVITRAVRPTMPSTITTPELTAVVSSVGMALLQTNALKGQTHSAHAGDRPAGEA